MLTSAALIYEREVPQAFAKSTLSAQPYQEPDGERVSMNVPTPDWLGHIKSQIEDFASLQRGWDSYSGRPISMGMRSAAFQVILELVGEKTPRPSVVPASDGTIQFEWHTKGIDLEIRVLSMTKIEVVFEDAQGQTQPIEDQFEYDFRRLASIMNLLSTR